MSFWLVDAAMLEGTQPQLAKALPMPDYNELDYSRAHSRRAVQHSLSQQDESLPPERLALLTDIIWKFVGQIEPEDIICAVQKIGDKPQQVYFAAVTGGVVYDAHTQRNMLPLRWYKEKAGMLRLKPYQSFLKDAGQWPEEVTHSKFALALRSHLPLPGNRFAGWGWLVLVLIIIKIMVISSHMWERF